MLTYLKNVFKPYLVRVKKHSCGKRSKLLKEMLLLPADIPTTCKCKVANCCSNLYTTVNYVQAYQFRMYSLFLQLAYDAERNVVIRNTRIYTSVGVVVCKIGDVNCPNLRKECQICYDGQKDALFLWSKETGITTSLLYRYKRLIFR